MAFAWHLSTLLFNCTLILQFTVSGPKLRQFVGRALGVIGSNDRISNMLQLFHNWIFDCLTKIDFFYLVLVCSILFLSFHSLFASFLSSQFHSHFFIDSFQRSLLNFSFHKFLTHVSTGQSMGRSEPRWLCSSIALLTSARLRRYVPSVFSPNSVCSGIRAEYGMLLHRKIYL